MIEVATGIDSDAHREAVRECLEMARRALAREIGRYPPPITGCDAQFNHLLDQRAGLARELQSLDHVAAGDRAALAAFVSASQHLDGEAKRRLLSQIAAAPGS